MTQEHTNPQPIEIHEQHPNLRVAGEQSMFLTPEDAPAKENFKAAAGLGALAAIGVANIVATAVSARSDSREGRSSRVNPMAVMMSQGAIMVGGRGAYSELKAGLAKRKASKQITKPRHN